VVDVPATIVSACLISGAYSRDTKKEFERNSNNIL